MELKQCYVTLNEKELEIFMFSLKRTLESTIKNHIKNLQGDSNKRKQEIFFEQNKNSLKLLKDCDIFHFRLYPDIIYILNQEVPLEEVNLKWIKTN